MKIYRGIKDLLYKQIDHHFINFDLTFCDYGPGTSYAYQKNLTDDYVQSCKKWSFLVTANFFPKNALIIKQKDLKDINNIDEGFILDNKTINKPDISKYAQSQGFDCIILEYDQFDPHVLLLPSAGQITVEMVELFTENQNVVDRLKKLKLKFDGTIFEIPINQIALVDNLLSEFI